MCVGPSTFQWKGNTDVPVCLTVLSNKFPLTQVENPWKGGASTSCQHSTLDLLTLQKYLLSNLLVDIKKQAQRG